MNTVKIAIFRLLFGLSIGLTSGELCAQRVTQPIISEYDYIGRATPDGHVNERGPIEQVNAPIPEKLQTAAEQLTGISGKSNKLWQVDASSSVFSGRLGNHRFSLAYRMGHQCTLEMPVVALQPSDFLATPVTHLASLALCGK